MQLRRVAVGAVLLDVAAGLVGPSALGAKARTSLVPRHFDEATVYSVGSLAVAVGGLYWYKEQGGTFEPLEVGPAPPPAPAPVGAVLEEAAPSTASPSSEEEGHKAGPEKVVVTKACYSGDAFGATRWPGPQVIRRAPAPVMERWAWSGPCYKSPASTASSTASGAAPAEEEAKQSRRSRRALKLARVVAKLKRAEPPAMERVAWSGSCYDATAYRGAAPGTPRTRASRILSAVANIVSRKQQRPHQAPPEPPSSPSPDKAAWRAACDASGVVSYFDFGLRLS